MSKIAYRKQVKHEYTQYTCRIKTDLLDKIKEIAEAEEISITEVINQSLEFAVKDYNGK